MIKLIKIILEIQKEFKDAIKEHPVWPDCQVRQIAKICEESGEALQAANNHLEIGASKSFIWKEVIHTAVTCVRYLILNMGKGK